MEKTHSQVHNFEISLLKGFPDEIKLFDDAPLVQSLIRGDYSAIIDSECCKSIFSQASEPPVAAPVLNILHNRVHEYVQQQSLEKQLDVFCIGVASLQAFIQCNWTGPKYKDTDAEHDLNLPQLLVNPLPVDCFLGSSLHEFVNSLLAVDGETISCSATHSELLVLAQLILSAPFSFVNSARWWLLRALYIHQQILDEHSQTLQSKLFSLSEELGLVHWIVEDSELLVMLNLEIARIHLHYGRVGVAETKIKFCLDSLNLEVGMVGALGKRTYFQLKLLPQPAIKIKIEPREDRNPQENNKVIDFPKDILLTDDVRLPKIVFSDPSFGEYPHLMPLEQAALIALFVLKQKSQAKDRLLKDELLPYLACLLSHPKVWAIQFASLLFRSRLESDHRRTVERSLLQTQALMDLDGNQSSLADRLQLFFCSYAPPRFVVAADCASIMGSIGSVQSALELYLKLQMWEDVIACYNHLKLRHKAAEVIREQLKKGETVKLLCYLGDATDDVSCYERAWELSNQRSAQAQRHWATFYFNKQRYKESIPHLKKSLEINSLQVSMWFRLGYAALMEHEWEESASAYRRYCALEPDSFEAWNNLAKAYILLGQKQKAYTALHEAVKCNYEMWQVWDNLMAVSSDCGDFEGVIHCYHRILDLKEKHIDEQILTVLTTVVIKGIKDCKGVPASSYKKKALELFGRITSKVMGNATVWQLYARLTASVDEQSAITRSKTAQYLQKAHTAAIQDSNWHKEFSSIRNVLKLCLSLADAYLMCKKQCSSPNEALQLLSSVKMSLRSVLTKIQQEHTDIATGLVHQEILEDYKSLETVVEDIQSQVVKLQNVSYTSLKLVAHSS